MIFSTWFEISNRPCRIGVFEIKRKSKIGIISNSVYAYWNGKTFCKSYDNPRAASQERTATQLLDSGFVWRGISLSAYRSLRKVRSIIYVK